MPTPTEGVEFFAQSSTAPSAYDSFGHQVLGIYLGPTPTGPEFSLAVHSTPSDEKAPIYAKIPILNSAINAGNTAANPLSVTMIYTQLPKGNWLLTFIVVANGRTSTNIMSSAQYGPTWNTAPSEGLDAVRYFTSQGGATPGGPLEWKNMLVTPSLPIPLPSPTAKL